MVHYTKKKKTLPFFDTENLIFVLSLNQYIYIYIYSYTKSSQQCVNGWEYIFK